MKFVEWLIIIVFCVVATMCTSMNEAYSAELENTAYTLAVVDIAYTKYRLDRGAYETNPMIGTNPSDKTLALSLLVQLGLIKYVNTKWPGSAKTFNMIYSGSKGLAIGISISTEFY